MNPLADRVRPTTLEDIVGQDHIIGQGKIINRIVESKSIPNMIFYGPSGTGKTTVAHIMAQCSHKRIFKLNGTHANMEDIKNITSQVGTLTTMEGILLYLDELHYLNKKQQQSLLDYIENGDITLIGSTTENVGFAIFNSLLSRCVTMEFKALNVEAMVRGIERALTLESERLSIAITIEEDAGIYLAEMCNGDLRRALNILELVINTNLMFAGDSLNIDLEKVRECSQSKVMYYDKNGDHHYNLLSYFQKTIRGSDKNASIHALARLIKAGDLTSICRRLLVIAAEDIGLAYPHAISIVKACTDSALQLGFPEARIPLAQATILLASLPKSNSVYLAIDEALRDLDTMDIGGIPLRFCDGNSNVGRNKNEVYLYPHDYENHYVKQDYLPERIANKKYYKYGNNKFENAMKSYWQKITKEEE